MRVGNFEREKNRWRFFNGKFGLKIFAGKFLVEKLLVGNF